MPEGARTLAEAGAIYLDTSAFPKIDLEGGNSGASRLVRVLLYGGRIPVFCSLVSLGEFFKVAGSKHKQAEIGAMGYLHTCRAILKDLEIGKIQRVEPPAERFEFLRLADRLVAAHGALGGGDVWHLMAALELKRAFVSVALLTFDTKLARSATAEHLDGVDGNHVHPDALIAELRPRGLWVPG